MVSSQALLQELPRLRRYSRALCGTQKRGDEFVADVLNVISKNTDVLAQSATLDVALFRAFCQRWQTVMADGFLHEQLTLAGEEGVDQSIALITPQARQAFLLTALEGFSVEQVSEILGEPSEQVDMLINQARDEISQQTSTSVLIVEDEFFIATQLERIVKDLGHAVLCIARTRSEVADGLRQMNENLLQPGLVLADIQLADGSSGIDAVNDLLETVSVPVIFITAYPERLLTGRSKEPTYLLNKPFSADALRAMITQALFFRNNETRI